MNYSFVDLNNLGTVTNVDVIGAIKSIDDAYVQETTSKAGKPFESWGYTSLTSPNMELT
jgi:hypothetical protein